MLMLLFRQHQNKTMGCDLIVISLVLSYQIVQINTSQEKLIFTDIQYLLQLIHYIIVFYYTSKDML